MATPDVSEPRAPHAPETHALRALSYASTEATSALARRMRMNETDLSAMSHVTASDGSLGPRELSARLGITPAAMTVLVDRLESAGHLQRERDPGDRRRIRLVPTASATTQVLGELDRLLTALDDLTDRFTPAERDAIRRYLAGATEAYRTFAAGAASAAGAE